MKVKRRRVLDVPQKVKSFIDNVRATTLDKIEEPLKDFSWDFDKGDFHHWVDLFNIFDTYLEKHIKPRKDLHIEENFLEADPPFPKVGVLQILRVTRVILENCTNKHFYGSYEQHLSALLASTDADVIEASLQTLAAFLKKTVGKSTIRDSSLISKLYAFSQGWGPKEEGLGLIACSMQSACDSIANEIGSTLYFEFYADNDKSEESRASKPSSKGLQVIRLTSLNSFNENTLGILHKLVEEYKVPSTLCFSLLTRLRFARAFDSLSSRQQYVCIRLYAFIVLVQASNGADDLNSFFNNEPEFVNELVSLLSYEDLIPEKIQILGLQSLAALCHDRSHQPTALTAVSSGGHRGILPGLMQKAVDSITSGSGKLSVNFAEALLCLVTVLVSSSPGSSALRDAGFIPTLLPFLKDTNPQHLNLLSTAVHVLEAFMDYSNPAVALFRELGGLDDTIARLKIEVSCVEVSSKSNTGAEGSHRHWKGKQTLHYLEGDSEQHYPETLVSYHRRLLIKALLRAISLGTYAPGSTTRICGSEENLLPQCLCIIFRKANDFGGGIFSLAATVMSDLIHKDPTCFSVLNAAELPRAFLDAIMTGVLISSEAIICIPQCLDALCLHSSGLQAVKDCNALKCFVKIFTSKTYLRALSGDAPMSLSSSLDELIRHSSSLKSSAVNLFIEILDTILKIGSGSDGAFSFECQSYSTLTPMETDAAERDSVCLDEGESSKVEGSKQMIMPSPDVSELSTEAFLPECISNTAHLLEAVLQNADTCSSFIERKGIESVLQLFSLPLLPLHISIGQAVADAFKNFSPQHSATLVRTVCSQLWEHIKQLNELLASVGNVKLMMHETAKQMKVLRSLSALEGLLSLSNFLLKGSTNMILELGSSDAGLLKDLGKVYKDLIWQISLCNDSEENCDQSKETKTKDISVSNFAGRESDDETSAIPLLRFMSPFSVRSGSASHWSAEQEFFSAVRSAEGPHRHRHSRTRGERLSRQLDITHVDSENATNLTDTSSLQDIKKKNPDVLVAELLKKLGLTMRSFHNALVKGLSTRRRADHGSLSSACKTVTTALAKLCLEALSYSGNSNTSLEMSLAVKCLYLGKVVDDIIFLLVDSRKRSCNIALVNSFYVNGAFKELLTTFEATSQLLWTIPPGHGQEKEGCANRLSHSSWLLYTLQSYCRLLAYFVNASVLLSPSLHSQAQLLVQPVTAGLSIGLFPVPRDPQVFVQMLQSQVLDVILPIWNHPMFSTCSPSFISSVVCIVTHVYSGVGDQGRGRNSIIGSAGQRISVPSLDESSISSIVEMGFSRNRAEEALRNINTNSVEMAMDWLLSHPEDNVQEDVQLAQALKLSLGNSSELPNEESTNKLRASFVVERGAEPPPVDDILSASVKLFQCGDAVAFPLTDLLVTLCNRNKGGDRQRVALFLIQQLKICPANSPIDVKSLSQISHLLALLLCEDGSTRQIAAENGIVTASLDILANFSTSSLLKEDSAVSKCLSALFLILDNMVQSKPKVSSDTEGDPPVTLAEPSGNAISSAVQDSADNKLSVFRIERDTCTMFEKILGKPTGYLTVDDSQRALIIACKFIKMHVPAVVMQAIFQLCARLTKAHVLAMLFLDSGGFAALFGLPMKCFFPGFDSLASVIIRHLIEDPQTLQTAMELEIRQTLAGRLGHHAARLSPKIFLTSMAPVISRDPTTFMKAATAVCQLESSGGRVNIILSRDKEKEKPKSSSNDSGVMNADVICLPETRSSDVPSKCSRSHKKLPASLTQVINHLLEIASSYPLSEKHENDVQIFAPVDIDEPALKEKGKSKIDEAKKIDVDINSDGSPLLAKVTFALKLLSDILLMYVHAAGVVLRRDVEASQLQSLGQAEQCTHVGIVHHILHQLLPLSSDKVDEASDEWKAKLSEKASWFLVVLCGRSCEGRRRVITEMVKAFSSFSSLDNCSSKSYLAPNKKILVFADLLYSILSKNSSSSSLPSFGCSQDIVKSMIDNGVMQALTDILQVIDLDHPDAPKIVNLIVKALEILTRAANASEQLYKLDGLNKKKPTGATDRIHDQINPFLGCDVEDDPNINSRHQDTDAAATVEQQARGSSNNVGNQNTNQDLYVERDTTIIRLDDNIVTDLPSGQQMGDFMPDDMDAQGALHNIDAEGMPFRIEQQTTGSMDDEDDDMVEDAEDDDEDDEDDDDDGNTGEEETTLMSLADTDTEDHNENGLIDEYNDDIIDENDDDFPENRVIEVRWRGGLDGLDQLRILRGSGDASRLINITAEPFPGLDTGDAFHFRRPLGFDRHRQSGRNLGRAGLEGNPFRHPLLIRPSHPGETNISLWPSVGNTSREMDSLSVGSFDLPNFYMFDSALQSDYAGANLFGDRFASTVPQPLIDFPLGIDPLHVGGRRGPGDGRWTDDGQRQPGGEATAIAHAVEDHFVSCLRSTISTYSSSAQRQSKVTVGPETQEQDIPVTVTGTQPHIIVDDNTLQQNEGHQYETVLISDNEQCNVIAGFQERTNLAFTGGEPAHILAVEDPSTIVPVMLNDTPNSSEFMRGGEEPVSCGRLLETVHEVDTPLSYMQNGGYQVQDSSDVSANLHDQCTDFATGIGIRSSSHAGIDSGLAIPELSDGHADPAHITNDADTSGADVTGNHAEGSLVVLSGENEVHGREGMSHFQRENHLDVINNNESSSTNLIDPTFLEALPEDLRAEVLASQQGSHQIRPTQEAAYTPYPPEEIDPEFLAALPPDIQAEVLAQQRAQRYVQSQHVEGPVDMDNASILATFPPDLREEVLLTSPDTVLSSLPSNFLAEAQILRDRAANHYSTRSSLFGGSHRLGNRRLAVDRQTVTDRGVGGTIGRRDVSSFANNMKVKEIEGVPLMDVNALSALVRLLRLSQPLGKGLLQRLLLNLCAHGATRATLVYLLLDMIKPETEESVRTSARCSAMRLFGSQWNVCGRSHPSDGLPPLLLRRILEMLTYLATNHLSVANLLFYFDYPLNLDVPTATHFKQKSIKGKEKINDVTVSPKRMGLLQKGHTPLQLLLKLLNKPLFLRSNSHLEQVMSLLQVTVSNAVTNVDFHIHSETAAQNSKSQSVYSSQIENEFLHNSTDFSEGSSGKELSNNVEHVAQHGAPYASGTKTINPYDILLELSDCDLHNLCGLLAHEGLSDKVYSLAAEIVKKLAFIAAAHRKFFSTKLAGLAQDLSAAAVTELITLRSTEMLGLSASSRAGAAILRVLQTLTCLTSATDVNKSQDIDSVQEEQSILHNLNTTLEPLWQELSDCISSTESKLGENSMFSSPDSDSNAGDLAGSSSSPLPLLPPGAQRLLPHIEAFFVLCEKLQASQSVVPTDANVTATEVKESAVCSSPPSFKCTAIGSMTFSKVAEKHRRLLNAFIRQSPALLEKSLSMMLKVPRLIDFDNKRAFFRSRIRQQHDQHSSVPLRISVRRAYALEDSYNQLRLRSNQELKGRLTVQFQGEEGIDAGGLTREWYQLLSRVIFDKGALLFTTIGNHATFQPNPNSVYQTEHLSYFKFVGRVVAKALFDGQLLDVHFTRSFYKHMLGVKVTYHDIEAVDPDYYKNLKWMLENDVSDIPDLTFSIDADEEKHILYEKTEVTDYELKPGGRNSRVTEETKHEYVDLVADHILSTAIRPQINSFLEGFNELIPVDLVSIFNDKELELLISGLPEIDFDDLRANTEYAGYTAASNVVQWFWEVVQAFNKEDMARFLQFVTGTAKVPLEGFKALQGISGPQRFQIHKAYGTPERLPSAHTCFNQLDLPEYSSKKQLEERLLLAIHEASEGFGFG